jgi:hypothetical protein
MGILIDKNQVPPADKPCILPLSHTNDGSNNHAVSFDSGKRFGLVNVGQSGMKGSTRQQLAEGRRSSLQRRNPYKP